MVSKRQATDEGSVAAVLATADSPSSAVPGSGDADPAQVQQADARLDDLLERVAESTAAPAVAGSASQVQQQAPAAVQQLAAIPMRTAYPLALRGRQVTLRSPGGSADVIAELGPGVARELVLQAVRNRDAVLVECPHEGPPLVVGVIQTSMPKELNLKAAKVHLTAERELLLRAGRSAMRFRQDGDIELVGSRISALSRGLFRIVGRVLRLN